MGMFFSRSIRMLTPADAWQACGQKELVLVDVRQPQEWSSGVIPGARRIPLSGLSAGLEQLTPDQTVAFICRSGHRSLIAARRARRAGVQGASVKGGMIAWSAAGLPTKKLKGAR